MQSSSKTYVEYIGLALILVGGCLEALGLGVDYLHLFGGPNFYLAIDLEIAGLAAIFFGLVFDFVVNHA